MNDVTNSPAAPATEGYAPADVAYPKNIKSFVRRAGRTTAGQARAFETLGPKVLLPYKAGALDFVAAYADSAGVISPDDPKIHPVVLEIGFGMGEATAHIAATMPDTHFLCC